MTVFLFAVYGLSVLVAVGALLWACRTDFMTMTIPNSISIVMALAFIPAWGAATFLGLGVVDGIMSHLAALGIVFVVTFIMFAGRVWGAGDSKLITAASLWVGLQDVVGFLFIVAVIGFVLALTFYTIRFVPTKIVFPAQSWPDRVRSGERVIPYGIAIALGALVVMAGRGYVDLLSLIQSVG